MTVNRERLFKDQHFGWQVVFPALAAVFLLALFDLKVLSSHAWDPQALILGDPQAIAEGRTWNKGYDGQFSYAIAANPWGSTAGLDQPAYRYQRILHPLLARLFSFGRLEWIPWTMLAINLLAIGIGTTALGALLKRRSSSPWWALVFLLSAGYLLSIRLDLLEPLALGLALSGCWAYEEEKLSFAVPLFALAGLTKEIALVFPAALMIWEGLRRRWKRALVLGLSFIPYVGWFLFLQSWLGTTPTQVSQSRLMLIPFSGLRYLEGSASRLLIGLWVLFPAMVAGLAAFWDHFYKKSSPFGCDSILVLAQVALIAILPGPTWADPLALLRVGLGLLAAVLLWLASAHPRRLLFAAVLWAPSGLMLLFVPGLT